jgi:hypothetical protein
MGLPEGGMAGNRSSRKPSRNVETRTSCQPFDSSTQRVISSTLRALIRHAGMSVEEFLALL